MRSPDKGPRERHAPARRTWAWAGASGGSVREIVVGSRPNIRPSEPCDATPICSSACSKVNCGARRPVPRSAVSYSCVTTRAVRRRLAHAQARAGSDSRVTGQPTENDDVVREEDRHEKGRNHDQRQIGHARGAVMAAAGMAPSSNKGGYTTIYGRPRVPPAAHKAFPQSPPGVPRPGPGLSPVSTDSAPR